MTKRMLIDAAHPEETRVVIVDGSRVEELDFESRHKRQLRGNVYLAKVTRVEPSLQAAFIDYGGNRHGFLAFSEIHPDYYQLPYEDKLALQQQEEEELKDREASDEEEDEDDVEEDENLDPDSDDATDENDEEVAEEQVKVASRRRKQIRRRRYKIQEVIKRGQILLVQAVKEERGNKGAAMTTYLSLAGRYCVLMPNTPRGGGISRKIPNGSDRKRLKKIMDDLEVPQGMGVIVRTAGAKRTKAEITRDYGYLSRLWDEIRDTTLKSVAPALIHEEGNLVKRSIRDLYNKEIEEVLVQGDEAYKTAKSFIKMLMPSHAKFVKKYEDKIPLFLRFDVERQIENSLDATVQLKSGGYLVIHPTEALVSVDVNSGKSTKERNVERTALKTNIEAAEELARQMRLRDLAGLIVVDFIDMDENKNNRAVEKKMKDALSRDRARIQTGRISQFGLMEMSRQRRRRSLLEGSTAVCKHCDGVGRKRTVESAALAAIRAVEEFAIRGKAKKIRIKCPPDVALYLLNEKRDLLTQVDEDADVFTVVEHDDSLIRPAFTLEVVEKRSDRYKDPLVQIEKDIKEESKRSEEDRRKAAKSQPKDEEDDAVEEDNEVETSEVADEDEDSKPRRRRGRRGGRNRKRRSSESADGSEETAEDDRTSTDDGTDEEAPKPRRRRRRSAAKSEETEAKTSDSDEAESKEADDTEETPRRRRSSSRRKAPSKSSEKTDKAESEEAVVAAETTVAETTADEDPKPSRRRRAPSRAKANDDQAEKPVRKRRAPSKAAAETSDDVEAEEKPKRRRRAPAKSAADDAPEAAEEKPARRRRAPSKAKEAPAETVKAEDAPKPKRRRKAAAKPDADAPEAAKPTRTRKAPAKPKSDDAEDTPKPVRRRKAPAKSEDAPAVEETAKPKRRRAAPKTKATKTDAPKPEAKEPDAPAQEAMEAKAPSDDTPKRRRKAPARATAPAPSKVEAPVEPTPEVKADPVTDDVDGARRRKAPPRRKRGLIDRLMGKE
ncbi:MAG: Rne/Rng family ribonuclease [Litorimonas sp.]